MLPFLWNWAGKEAIKAFPWKWVIIGVVSLVLLGAGGYAVYSYNSAIDERDRLAVEKRIVEEEYEKKLHENALLRANNERLVNYMENAELARLQLENRLRAVATRKVKRDTQGNVAPDDPLLADLRGLFP
jgi:hypothetical protein